MDNSLARPEISLTQNDEQISPTSTEPSSLVPGSMPFDGPLKTTGDLKEALIQQMGVEKGSEMYDQFIASIMITSFNTLYKDVDRAQRAAKKMRAVYKDS